MKKTLILVSGLLLFAACSESKETKKDGEVVSLISAGGEEDQATLKQNAEAIKQQEKEDREALENITTLKFDKAVHDFGEVATGSENMCEFKVTNTGNKPLIITNVSASCGCTTPQKPEGPIAPGKSDIIKVGFKPNGPGPSEKTVTIQANTEPRISTVNVKAMVK